MNAQIDSSPESQLSIAARNFLRDNTMKSLLGIPEDALDAVMALAFQLYQSGRYREVEVLCRGLVAADHTSWWSYALYAATLRRLGKLTQALSQAERGLVYEPQAPRLIALRAEIRAALAANSNRLRAA